MVKIKSLLCFVLLIFLSSCASLDNIDTLFDDNNPKPNVIPQGPAYTKPISAIPDTYQSKKPAVQQKKEVKKIIKKQPIKHRTLPCNQQSFLKHNTISTLYRVYVSNKGCKEISDAKAASHLTIAIANNFTQQDIRILNADSRFLGLFASAISRSSQADKVMLNKQLLGMGCHLLKPKSCAIIRKSLF